MSISYEKLHKLLNTKGYSLYALYKKGVISDMASRSINAGKPVSLSHIDSLCQYFNLPIEQIVEIKLDGVSDDQTNPHD